jgi:hypothetical protein
LSLDCSLVVRGVLCECACARVCVRVRTRACVTPAAARARTQQSPVRPPRNDRGTRDVKNPLKTYRDGSPVADSVAIHVPYARANAARAAGGDSCRGFAFGTRLRMRIPNEPNRRAARELEQGPTSKERTGVETGATRGISLRLRSARGSLGAGSAETDARRDGRERERERARPSRAPTVTYPPPDATCPTTRRHPAPHCVRVSATPRTGRVPTPTALR